jgi:hypothetical protein
LINFKEDKKMKIINDRVAMDMINIMDDLNILYDVEVRKMLVLETVQAYKRNLEDAKTLKRYNDILSDFRNMLVEVIENEMEKRKPM